MAYGFPFPPLSARMDIFSEQLQVVLGNWAEGPFSFDGEYYTSHDLDAQQKTHQRPHPPLIMGGIAGRRGARLAAQFADEYEYARPVGR